MAQGSGTFADFRAQRAEVTCSLSGRHPRPWAIIERLASSGHGVRDVGLLRFGDVEEALFGGRGGYPNAGAA